jgi:hypothetical protein
MKLTLRIEDLRVATFQPAPAPPAAHGTVRANASDPNSCYPAICASGEWTCLDTCQDTCGLSCHGTCIPAYCTGDEG